MPAPLPDDPSPVRDALKQHLRLRRLLLSSAFSLLYLVVLAIFYSQGAIDRDTLVAAFAIVVGLIGVFYAVIRLGWNLRFPDPSLTAAQVLAAVFTMLFVFYRAPQTRLAFVAFFFVALMFGMLRGSWKQLTVLGTVSLAGFALTAWIRYLQVHDAQVLRLDLLQLVVTVIAFPWFVYIGSRVTRLHEADRRKDDFLATLAHELRNPLAPIRAGVHILGLPGGQSHAATVLPMMERQLQHLTRLLDDLLDVSRITRGKFALQVEPMDLAVALQAAVEANRPLIEQMGHELTVSLPKEPVALDADSVRLAQVFSNLLNNAAKYTAPGGRIALKAERQGDTVVVSVSDNGIGIARENLAAIFDMFTQIETATARAQAGLGIGLALVRGLVALHGGTIEVSSEGPDRGSEFRVRLPTREALPLVSVAAVRPERRRGKQKVLVVDDNPDVASSMATLAEMLGHEVRVTFDGDNAVRLAAEFRPQTVLLDLGMPGVDGFEVCRRIRAEPWGGEVKLIAVTGWGQEEDRRKSADAGFDGHLVKPVGPETLVELLGDLRSRSI